MCGRPKGETIEKCSKFVCSSWPAMEDKLRKLMIEQKVGEGPRQVESFSKMSWVIGDNEDEGYFCVTQTISTPSSRPLLSVEIKVLP
jgi:hypothetical protein